MRVYYLWKLIKSGSFEQTGSVNLAVKWIITKNTYHTTSILQIMQNIYPKVHSVTVNKIFVCLFCI